MEEESATFAGHEAWVLLYTRGMLDQLGLARTFGDAVEEAVRFHDIGERFIPQDLLFKPGRLTEQERLVIQRHALVGEQFLRRAQVPEDVRTLVRWHHERIDGLGYPDGLHGRDIPIGARIIAVADTFDALTSDRPYRSALSWVSALDKLEEEAGAQLDPICVAALQTWLERYAKSFAIRAGL